MRLPELDVLRFFAIALVIGRHSFVCPASFSPLLNQVTALICQVGWIGVDLFFVLSGFLISGLLFKEWKAEGKINVGRFYLRRGCKIYPSFWLLMAMGVGVALWQYGQFYQQVQSHREFWTYLKSWLWPNLLFVQNYVPDVESNLVWSVRMTWSLAIEEHFYLLLPLLLLCLMKATGDFRLLPFVFCGVAVSCLYFRLLAGDGAFTTARNLMPTHLRMDSLFFGVLLRYWKDFYAPSFEAVARLRPLLVVGGLLLLSPVLWLELSQSRFLWTYGFTQVYVGCGLILVGLSGSNVGTGWLGRMLARVGTRSYSIYLFHVVSAWVAGRMVNPTLSLVHWLEWMFVYLAGAIALGFAAAAWCENPMLRWRDRLIPARHSPEIIT